MVRNIITTIDNNRKTPFNTYIDYTLVQLIKRKNMEAKVFFDNNIKPELCNELNKATKHIYAAVAWFNDSEIFDILKNKLINGVDLNLIVANDEINNALPFKELSELGGKVFKLITENTLLHHKFCVIDEHTLITGSYNWTYAASTKNLENIVILENNIKINQTFIQCYNDILENEFKYIEETIDILGYMQDEIENLKINIKKYKEVPEHVLHGIEKIKNQNLMLNTPLNSLLSLEAKEDFESNTARNKIEMSRDEKVNWWNSLEFVWKYYFNDRIFRIGLVQDMPDDEGLDNLLTLSSLNCSKFKYYNKENQTTYIIINLNGIKEISSINSIDCSTNNITKLDAISGHKNLVKLICHGNKIQSLESLSLLKNLSHLECHNNAFTSLRGIENLKSLTYLKIDSRLKEFPKDKERIDSLGLIEVGQDGNYTEYRK